MLLVLPALVNDENEADQRMHPDPATLPHGDQAAWRKACSTFGISHRVLKCGTRHELTMKTMRRVYTDAYVHQKAHQGLQRLVQLGGGVAYAFWHCLDPANLTLPVHIVHGLLSCVLNAGFAAVYLLTYQTLDNVPAGVTVWDANQFMPLDFFKAVLAKAAVYQPNMITWLSDYLRLLACAASNSRSSTFIDCDIVWARLFPFESLVHGHAFATFNLNRVSRDNFDLTNRVNKLTAEYCFYPMDYLKMIPPFTFSKGSVMLRELVGQIDTLMVNIRDGLLPICRMDYDYIMDMVRQSINDHGLRQSFLDPMAFAVIPYYAWSSPTERRECRQQGWGPNCLDDPNVIGFINWWQSSKLAEGPAMRSNPQVLHENSFWLFLLKYCLGVLRPNRRLQGKKTIPQVWTGIRPAARVLSTRAAVVMRTTECVVVLSGYLSLRDQLAMLPISGSFRCLRRARDYVDFQRDFCKKLWGDDMRDLLRTFARLDFSQSCGVIGKMIDLSHKIDIETPMLFTMDTQILALLLLALNLFGDISAEQHTKLRKEIIRRMALAGGQQQVHAAQCEYVRRLPNAGIVPDAGVIIGAAVSIEIGQAVFGI